MSEHGISYIDKISASVSGGADPEISQVLDDLAASEPRESLADIAPVCPDNVIQGPFPVVPQTSTGPKYWFTPGIDDPASLVLRLLKWLKIRS